MPPQTSNDDQKKRDEERKKKQAACRQAAERKRRAAKWKAANNRAKEFDKHFSATELAFLAGGCVIGGLGAFAATPEFVGYTIP
jgi:hypothetical protein